MPLLRGVRGSRFPDRPEASGPEPYVLCDVMHEVICDSRRASKFGKLLDGSSRWHTGHSSSSGICGGGGNGRFTEDDDDEDDPYGACES